MTTRDKEALEFIMRALRVTPTEEMTDMVHAACKHFGQRRISKIVQMVYAVEDIRRKILEEEGDGIS